MNYLIDGASPSDTCGLAAAARSESLSEAHRIVLPVTIVVSFRERWRFTPLAIETIIKNTSGNYALWLLDSGMPDEIGRALRPYVEAGKLEIIEVRPGLQPNDVRGQVVSRLMSSFAVFIDNDAIVSSGWLDRMVACAEETGAGIVCPLYLWGDKPESDLIHMAGGDLSLVPENGGVRMTEHHRHLSRTVSEVSDELRRETCGFGEYHCLLMRREVYSIDGIFDPDVVTVHEHIHASLKAKALGYATWFEPEAQVNHLASAPWTVGELYELRRRWDFATAQRSLEGFAKKWGVIDDPAYRHFPLNFVTSYVGQADMLDARPWLGVKRERLMTRQDLQETFGGWEWLAIESGYAIEDVEIFANAYLVAVEHTNGVYRPCGRPFVNHLVGTASVLLFYGCPMRLILAGLLHGLFGPGATVSSANADRAFEQVSNLGSAGGQAAELIQLYSERARLLDEVARGGKELAELPVQIAGLYLLEAANEIDMHLSFEVAVSARSDLMTEKRLCECHELLESIGLTGLAATLQRVRQNVVELPNVNFQGGGAGSFCFSGGRIVSAYG